MDITNQISMVIPEDEDTKKLIESYQNFKVKLDTVMSQTVNNFVVIGYMLKLARDTGVLEQSQYKTLTEFAQTEYGLRPDEVSRFVAINDRYAENGYSARLDGKYIGYGYSKLSEMLTLPPAVADQLEPDMSREDIRAIKQEYQEAQEETPLELAIEEQTVKIEEAELKYISDVQPTNDMEEAVYRFFAFDLNESTTEAAISRDLFKRLNGMVEVSAKRILEAIAPNESRFIITRLPGRGRVQLKVYADGRKVMLTLLREGLAEEYDSEDFVEYVKRLTGAGTGKSAKDMWEQAYQRRFMDSDASEVKIEKKKESKVAVATATRKEKPEAKTAKQTEAKAAEQTEEEQTEVLTGKVENAEIAPAQMDVPEETENRTQGEASGDEDSSDEGGEETETDEEPHFISSEEWNRRFDNYYEILGNTFRDVGRHLRSHNFTDAKYSFRELMSVFEKIVSLPQKEEGH